VRVGAGLKVLGLGETAGTGIEGVSDVIEHQLGLMGALGLPTGW
jgi:fibrillarin-like rRNA methylase